MTGTAKQSGNAAEQRFPHTWEVVQSLLLAVCCFLSYEIITGLLTFSRFVPRDDELLGGMWAVVATIFVFRSTCEESVHAALSRMSATSLSFALCLAYLLVFPFRLWGLILLIALGSIVLALMGRSEDIITANITTTVVMVLAGVSPEHAWKQPILRVIDTLVGVAVGVTGAWFLMLARRIPSQSSAA